MDRGPIFLGGLDRSGIGFLCELLESHPRIAMSRRTNYWSYFFNRYGDLSKPENFEQCLGALLRFRRTQALQPNPEALRREFFRGETSYARLFALIHEQNARRLGKARWGDKSLNSEEHAQAILAAYPTAKFVHVIRDPRDRHASAMTHRGVGEGKTAEGTALWLWSVRLAERHLKRYPGRYLVVRYETLVERPEETLRGVCEFLGESYDPAMLVVNGSSGTLEAEVAQEHQSPQPRVIRTTSIGHFRGVLSKREVAFVQLYAGQEMSQYQYALEPVHLSASETVQFLLADCPISLARILGWRLTRAIRGWNGRNPSARRTLPPPMAKA